MNAQLKLGEIITQIRGVSYKPSDVRAAGDPDAVALLRANNIQEDGLNFDDLVWVDKHKVSAEQYLRMGDILICSSSGSKGLVGKAAIVTNDLSCAFGAFCKVVRTKAEYASYLGQFFRSPRYRKEISASAAGANINNIRNEHIDDMFISMPSENERAGCVAKLGQIDYLIQKSNNQTHQLDQLVKSRFVEMFGDPVTNSAGRKQVPFSSFMMGIRYGASQPPEFSENGEHKFIRATNIKNGHITEKDMLRISVAEAVKIEKCKLHGNEIIIVRSGANTGDTCVVTEKYVDQYAGYDIIVSLDLSKANPVFFNELINTRYMQRIIKPLTARSAQPHLNAQQVSALPMIVASLDEQNKFAAFVAEVDKSKLSYEMEVAA